jgi:hypothetical protein
MCGIVKKWKKKTSTLMEQLRSYTCTHATQSSSTPPTSEGHEECTNGTTKVNAAEVDANRDMLYRLLR